MKRLVALVALVVCCPIACQSLGIRDDLTDKIGLRGTNGDGGTSDAGTPSSAKADAAADSSAKPAPPDQGDPALTDCDVEAIRGVFWVSYDDVNGNCSDLSFESGLTEVSFEKGSNESCKDKTRVVSPNRCRLERRRNCKFGEKETTVLAITTQTGPDGAFVSRVQVEYSDCKVSYKQIGSRTKPANSPGP